jgi:glycosyltransferase involved in cell wall biosynthesis
VNNQDIAEVYKSHDVLILPSIKEPWGLVVDEALFYGLPVIVSDHVGCFPEMVSAVKTGLIFHCNNSKGLEEAVRNMANPAIFAKMKDHVKGLDFAQRDEEQIKAYSVALNDEN